MELLSRCAVFVDAGYLLAGGGDAFIGTTSRSEIGCDLTGITRTLMEEAERRSGLPVLRLYWYDAAPNAVPMPEHIELGRLPRVKVRLGRLIGGQQKGVDSMLVRDLMVLSRERGIATAFVFGGDEDLLEGVRDAQDRGVQVSLFGYPPSPVVTPSDALVREADDHIRLDADVLRPHFTKRAGAIRVLPAGLVDELREAAADDASAFGAGFGRAWADAASRDELKQILGTRPQIPRPLDTQLLMEAERHLGSLREDESMRIDLRSGFWDALSTAWDARGA